MSYNEPPNINVDKLDFSQFHPLDHWPWESRCREFHGGWRTHLEYAWHDRRKPQIQAWFGKKFCCWWGHHSPGQAWQRPKGWQKPMHKDDWRDEPWVTYTFCYWCFRRLSEDQPQ